MKKILYSLMILQYIFPLGCSKKHKSEHLYPSTGFYALKLYAALNTIDQNFSPNTAVVYSDIKLTQLEVQHWYDHDKGTRDPAYPKRDTWGHSYVVEVTGQSIKEKLSVAALPIEFDYGHDYPLRDGAQKISLKRLSLLNSANVFSLVSPHLNPMPAPIQDHAFFTIATGSLPQLNSTLTNGVAYPFSIGITSPQTAPLVLAYYPLGAFEGYIPSYAVNNQSNADSRISKHVNNVPVLFTDTSARIKIYGSYTPSIDKVTGFIEHDYYQYGTFSIQDVQKPESILQFEIFGTPIHK